MRRLLVVAGVAVAAGAQGETLTPVATLEDARAVCANADATRHYRMGIPSKGFHLAPYDRSRARLAVDVARGVRGEDGAVELVPHHIAGLVQRSGGLDVALPVDAHEAPVLAAAHARGELGLRLIFQLAAPADGSAVCAELQSAAREGLRIAIEPLAFEITRGGARIASGETPQWTAARDRQITPASVSSVESPRVVVSPPMLTSAGGKASGKVARIASALAPRLVDCYRLGLDEEPGLRGPFVAGVEVAADGQVVSARAELDGLGVPQVTTCVLRHVRAARFPAGTARLSIPMRFTD